MSRYKIVAITPLGTYESVPFDAEIDDVTHLIEQSDRYLSLLFAEDGGRVYLKSGILANSVIKIVPVEGV